MSALPKSVEARFEAFVPGRTDQLNAVLAVELRAYASPWSRANFVDALSSGNQAQLLMADDELLGYFIALKGVDEVHLLNLTISPEHQGCGWAWVCLDALAQWARGQAAKRLWLEVRVSNVRAIKVYAAHGYQRVGQRKNYYPAPGGLREDAIVMSLDL